MVQVKTYQSDFSNGGYVVFSDGNENPAFFSFKGSELVQVSIPKKINDNNEYLHSECVKYDLTLKRDRTRLKKLGVVVCKYDTPTTMSLNYNPE